MIFKNKKAEYNYELIETFTAGIQLCGSEVKSLRKGNANITTAWCHYDKNNIWLKNMQIDSYAQGGYSNHDTLRDRKLLLESKQLRKISVQLEQKGLTVIPLLGFFNEKGWFKINIALAKGKRNWDKRNTIKMRDLAIDTARNNI